MKHLSFRAQHFFQTEAALPSPSDHLLLVEKSKSERQRRVHLWQNLSGQDKASLCWKPISVENGCPACYT